MQHGEGGESTFRARRPIIFFFVRVVWHVRCDWRRALWRGRSGFVSDRTYTKRLRGLFGALVRRCEPVSELGGAHVGASPSFAPLYPVLGGCVGCPSSPLFVCSTQRPNGLVPNGCTEEEVKDGS